MISRILLEHDRPRACGNAPLNRDVLRRTRSGYSIDWSAPYKAGTYITLMGDPEITTHYRTPVDALADWYQFPREGERRVGRFPRGFEAARRAAREGR